MFVEVERSARYSRAMSVLFVCYNNTQQRSWLSRYVLFACYNNKCPSCLSKTGQSCRACYIDFPYLSIHYQYKKLNTVVFSQITDIRDVNHENKFCEKIFPLKFLPVPSLLTYNWISNILWSYESNNKIYSW